jgi:hypothetical protein
MELELEMAKVVRECYDRIAVKHAAEQLGEDYPTDRRHDETIGRGADRRGA